MQNNRSRHRKPEYSRDKNLHKAETIENILPNSEILAKFEDAVPGSVEQLIEMAQKEQKHRHNWQDQYLKSHNFNTRFGQICGLFYNIALLGLIFKLIDLDEKELALKLFFINAAVISFVVIFTTFERKVFSRRPRKNRIREDNRKRNFDKKRSY
ncbi:MAG: DUF2335 domain-containing protein [Rickettsiales bacterium]|nr:DUF2335 domain-containing protein [Rickettsiales bacterium]